MRSVGVIGPCPLRHPLHAGRDTPRVRPQSQLGAVKVPGDHRQAVAAVLPIVPEAEVVELVSLAQARPGCELQVQPRLDPLVQRAQGVEGGRGNVRPNGELEQLAAQCGAVEAEVEARDPEPAPRANLDGAGALGLQGHEGGDLRQFREAGKFVAAAPVRVELQILARFPQ